MDLDKIVTNLFDLRSMIKPGDPERLIADFGKELMRRFGFECFEAEIPILDFKIRIPKTCTPKDYFEFSGKNVTIRLSGEFDDTYVRIIRPLLEDLDSMIVYSIFYDALNKILEYSRDVIFVLNKKNGRVVLMNKMAREIFGNVEFLPEVLKGDVSKVGDRYYSIAKYDLGNLEVILCRDITEIKRLEELARENEERFRTLAELVPVAIFVYTPQERFVFVNKFAEELTGYTKEELLSGTFWEIFPEEEVNKVKEAMRRRLRGEYVEPYKLRIKRKDGSERVTFVYGSIMLWRGERVAIIALSDITTLEEERRKIEELSKMLSLINRILRHDILNAITSALMSLDMYKETNEKEFLEMVEKSLRRCENIIKTMRSFEEMVVKREFKPLNVREIAKDVADGFNIPINVEGDCTVIADEGLRAVIENLIQNAIQHGKTDRVDIRIKKVGDFCEIRVIDYGKGIPDEIKDKVFEEGFTYGENAGTGMGLHIVKKVIERYGGEIWIEDNKPHGAIFVIRLKCI